MLLDVVLTDTFDFWLRQSITTKVTVDVDVIDHAMRPEKLMIDKK
jgi:hypothetical protein